VQFCKTGFVMEGEVKVEVKVTLEQAPRPIGSVDVLIYLYN